MLQNLYRLREISVINLGTLLERPGLLSSSGIYNDNNSIPVTGYSFGIRANGMEAALEIAMKCLFPETGTLEIAQMKEM